MKARAENPAEGAQQLQWLAPRPKGDVPACVYTGVIVEPRLKPAKKHEKPYSLPHSVSRSTLLFAH